MLHKCSLTALIVAAELALTIGSAAAFDGAAA